MINDFLVAKKAYEICLKEKKRITEFELFIAKSFYFSLKYARDILKSRWPDGESIILKNAYCSFWYANDVVKGRWEEAENVIATDVFYAYMYARDILDGPFYIAHNEIMNSYWGDRYKRNIKDKTLNTEWLI